MVRQHCGRGGIVGRTAQPARPGGSFCLSSPAGAATMVSEGDDTQRSPSWEDAVLTARLVGIDPMAFDAAFARRSIAVRHSLADHPLLTLEAIAQLADRLPPGSVRRERGIQPIGEAHRYVDVGHGRPSASVLDVENNGFRISLRNVQQIPEYSDLVDACL